MSGGDCFNKNNAIRQGMGILQTQLKHILGVRTRVDEIFLVNMNDGGMQFDLEGSDPHLHGTHKRKTHVLQPDQGSLFHMNKTRFFNFGIAGAWNTLENGHSYMITTDSTGFPITEELP